MRLGRKVKKSFEQLIFEIFGFIGVCTKCQPNPVTLMRQVNKIQYEYYPIIVIHYVGIKVRNLSGG